MSEGWKLDSTSPVAVDGWALDRVEPIEQRTLGERASENLADAAATNPTIAAARQDFSDPFGTVMIRPGGMPSILPPTIRQALGLSSIIARNTGMETPDILSARAERDRRQAFQARSAADPFYAAPGGIPGKIAAGAATLAGQLGGSALDPLNLAAPGKTPVMRVLAQGGINAAVDVPAQGADIQAGIQENYDPLRTAVSGAAGLGLAGLGEAARPAGRWVVSKVEEIKDAGDLRRARKDAARAEEEVAQAVARPWTDADLWSALERQESGGKQEATSEKGARGVAQLLPDTAAYVAEYVGNPSLAQKAMENTEEGAAVNRWLGQVYLGMQFRDFGQDPVLALAAYNAGPGRVRQWLARFGHPDTVGRAKWVEMIPFDETRKYVRTILGNAAGGRADLGPDEITLRQAVLKEHKAEERAARTAPPPESEVAKVLEEQAQPAPRAAEDVQQQMADRSAEIEQELSDFPGDRPTGTGEIVEDPWDAADGIQRERDLTDDALDIIRGGQRVQAGEGPSLVDALVKEGGLRDEAGELTHILGGVGDDRRWKMLRRVNTGRPLDDAALWAWERGYIGEPGGARPTARELLDAIAEEARGRPRYAAVNAERQAMADRVSAIEEMLQYLGIDPRGMSNLEIRRAMDDFMEAAARAEEELEPGALGVKPPNQPDMFDADASQKAGQLAADLERMIRERQAKRGREPLPEGGLFDETRRGEQDLFGLGPQEDDGFGRAAAAAIRLLGMDERLASTKGSLRAQPKATAIPARPGEALPNVKGVRVVARELLRKLDLVRRQGRVGMRGALGTYSKKTGMIRTLGAHELDVVAHEIGHAIEFTKKFPSLLAAMKKHKALLKALDYQPKLARRYEGFAEWFRWYVTNPEYARQLSPEFWNDFEAAMRQDAPKDFEALQQAQKDYQAFLTAPSVAAARQQVMEPPGRGLFNTIWRRVKDEGPIGAAMDFGDEIYRGVFDSLNPWKRAVKRLDEIYYRNTGKRLELSVLEDPYKLLRQMPAVAGAGHMDIMYGVHGYQQLEPDTPSLADALKIALGDKIRRWDQDAIRDFGTYLTGRRMIALYDNFAAGKLEQPPDSMSREFWEQAVADLDLANPTWAEAAGVIYDWNDALLMKRLNAGLITPETFAQVREDHAEYVPLFRDVEDKNLTGGARGASTDRAGGLIRLKGSDRAVINPVHSMMQQAYELNAAIARNDALKALDDLGRTAGPDGGQIVERLPRKEIKGTQVDAIQALDKAAKEIGVSKADRQFVMDTLEQLFGDEAVTTVYRGVDMTPRPGENVLYVWRDGVKQPLQLPDGKWGRDMIESLAGATPPMSSLWLEMAAMPARILRAGVTTHPTFFAANWIRDQFTAAVLTDVGYIPGVDNIRGIGAEARQGDLSRIYNLAGGEIGGMNVAAEHRARGQRDVNALRTKGRRLRHFGSFDGFAKFTELSETGTRLGIFDRALRRAQRDGLDDYAAAREASFEARDYMDFDRHGAWPGVRSLIRIIPFFNAALQAFDKTNRVAFGGVGGAVNAVLKRPSTVGEERAAQHAMKFLAVASLLAVGSLALRAAFEDDPEYQQLADYLRNTHWVLPVPGTDEYAVIPKPYDVAVLANIFERAFEGVTMKDATSWGRLLEGLRDIWLPPLDAPIAMVPLELARNRDSFGAPIVPDHLLHTRQKVDQKTDSTSSLMSSPLAMAFAEALKTVTGGQVDLGPAQLDYTVRSVGGTWARDVLRAFDDRAPIEDKASEAPLLSRFVKDWSRGAVATKEFFKYVATNDGKFTSAANSWGDLIRSGEFDEASERLAKMKPEERAYVLAATFEKGVDKQAHPLIRATEAVRELGGLAKALREGDVMTVDPATGGLAPLRLTPAQRRAAVDGLKKMAVAEQNNALIAAGVEDWDRGRLPLPAEKYAREVEAKAPGVMAVLSMRFQQAKIMPPEEMHRRWAAYRPYMERQQDPAQLRLMMQAKMGSGSGAEERALKAVVDAPK